MFIAVARRLGVKIEPVSLFVCLFVYILFILCVLWNQSNLGVIEQGGLTLLCLSKGTFFWDYSGIRITEHTEYQFPKEQTL